MILENIPLVYFQQLNSATHDINGDVVITSNQNAEALQIYLDQYNNNHNFFELTSEGSSLLRPRIQMSNGINQFVNDPYLNNAADTGREFARKLVEVENALIAHQLIRRQDPGVDLLPFPLYDHYRYYPFEQNYPYWDRPPFPGIGGGGGGGTPPTLPGGVNTDVNQFAEADRSNDNEQLQPSLPVWTPHQMRDQN